MVHQFIAGRPPATQVRIAEYSSYAKVKRFWSDRLAAKFEQIMVHIKEIDANIHQINPEVKRIELSDNNKEVIPIEKLRSIAETIKPKNDELRKEVKEFLRELVENW